MPAVEKYPKSSPDLNAIEGVWHLLRQLLDEEAPDKRETRSQFLARLRQTAAWMNKHRKDDMLKLCTNQRTRARDVQLLKGARTKW